MLFFVTKQSNFTAITKIMKTLSNSHHKFYYVAYCFLPLPAIQIEKKKLNNVFVVCMFMARATKTGPSPTSCGHCWCAVS